MEETQERWNVYIPERNTTVNVPKNWDYSTIMSELDKKQKEEQKNLNQEVAKIQGEKYRSLSKPTYNFSYYNDLLESLKEKKIGEETSPIKTGAKSFVNQLYDLTVGATVRGVGQTSDIVENAVGTFQARKLSPKQREKFLKEIDKEGRESARKAQESAEKFAPFKIREGESKTAQGLSSALVSFGLMGLSGALNGLSKGMTVKEGLQKGLPIATLFGVSSGQEMYGKVREGGGSFSEALLKGESAMLGEIALEEAGVATLLKGVRAKIFAPYPWAGFIVTSAGTGAVQETSQGLKDVIVAGKYDERVNEEKLNELLDDAIFGAIGEMFGGVVSSTVHRERRAKIRNQAVKAGYDEQTANVIAWEATENPEGIANAVIDEMKDFNNVLSAEDIQRGQEFIEEAQRIGGKDADTYVNIMNTYKQVGKLGGLTEEEIRKDAEYFANAHTSLFLALKDKDPNLTYEQYADKIKLNSLRIIQDINIEREVNKRVKETLPWFGETSELTAKQVDEVERVAQNERYNVMREAGLIKDDDTLYSMIGERAKLTKQQKTSLDEAKSLEQDGLLNNEQIRQTTGWYRGDDGEWKLEISDMDMKFKLPDMKEYKKARDKNGKKIATIKLGNLMEHEKLFKEYPFLENLNVHFSNEARDDGTVAETFGDTIVFYNKKIEKLGKEKEKETKKAAIHEIQHVIQDYENFARGGEEEKEKFKLTKEENKLYEERNELSEELQGSATYLNILRLRRDVDERIKSANQDEKRKLDRFKEIDEQLKEKDKESSLYRYYSLGGEIEANNVADRIDFTDEERRKISPEQTRLIPKEDVIIRRKDDTLQSRYNASYSDAKKIIRLFKGHNPQALVHELSHNFFIDYFKLTEEYGLTEKNKAIYDMLGKKSYKEFGKPEWETITEEFMKYLKTNEAPNIALSGLFRRAKDWLIETFFTTNKSETPSPEVKEFFDNLIKEEYGTVDATSLRMTPRTFKEIIKDIKSGKEVSFQGVRRSDLQALRKILHQTRPRKAKTLAEEMRKDDMRIKADSELAKKLGYDPKKKQPMFDKNGTIERIDELDDYLVEKGLLEPNQAETAEQVSDRENKIENIINQAEDVYSAEEQTYADYRDIVEQNQLRVSELVDEILKDNELGIKDIDEINEYLDKAIAMAKKVDSVLVNKEAIKFLVEGYENAEKLYNKTLQELQKAQDVIGVRQQLTDYIRSLPLTAKHRLSLMTKVKQINKGDDFTEVLGNINDSFKRMWEQETKEILANNINEILKSTKPKERRKQKYNYDYNTLFEELRTINGYTKEQASKSYEDILNEVRDSDSADYVETDEDREINAVKRMLVSYKMNGRKDSSIALMKRLESELFKLRQDAIEDKARTETEKAIKKKAEIDRAVGYIKKHKKVGKVLGFYLKNTNLYSNEAELFGKDWAKAHEMETIELEQNRKVKAKTKEMIKKGKKIYGIPDDTGSKKMFSNSDKEFARIINEKSQEKFTLYGVNGKAQNLERKISLLQIMDIYNTIKNKNSADIYSKLYETFDEEGNQTSHQIQDLLDNLSEQDKAFADAIMADIQSLRDSENEIYVKLYGIDMPKHEPYYPRSAERVEGELMDIKKFAIGDDTPSFFKERAKMSLLVPRNMWTKYQSRINDSMYMTNTFEKYKEHYDLIHNSEVKNAIEAKYDTKRYMSLNTSLKDLSLGGNNKAFDDMENFMSNLVSNWVVSKIALNDAVFTKQLLSMTNFIENMPVADFFKYSKEMLTNPKKAFDFMQKFDGAYLNQRFTDGMQNEALAQIMANAERSVKKRDYIFQDYIDFVTLPVRLGDVGAIYLGGYARARYLLEHGTPIEEARKIFEFESQQSQQSGLKASMAQFQKNTIFRFFTAFKNTQLQYQRKLLDGFIQWRRGEIDTKHYAKIVGNYAFLQAFMYQVATNIFSYWRDDDDDKEFDWSKDVAMQIITSPVAGVPLLGDMTQNLLKKQSYDLGIAGLQDANKAFRLAKKSFNGLITGEFDPKTAEKAGALMLQFVKPMPANILTTILND